MGRQSGFARVKKFIGYFSGKECIRIISNRKKTSTGLGRGFQVSTMNLKHGSTIRGKVYTG